MATQLGNISPDLQRFRRVVIKIGSALLVEDATGHLHDTWLKALCADIAALKAHGTEVLIVSSGSIAAGRRRLGLEGLALKLEEKQAAASVGQITLAHAYQDHLAREGVTVAQILLTPADTEERRRHLNARATILQLLSLGAVPVINENDTVATQEIRYGDNDRLAARVATMVSADGLVLLSDIDGLYHEDPHRNPDAEHIPVVTRLTPDILAMAGDAHIVPIKRGAHGGASPSSEKPVHSMSTGGMVTKLEAAKIALAGGCSMVIAKGDSLHPVRAITEGARCTWFVPTVRPNAARKQWIAGSLTPTGGIVIDAGASAALNRGKSLLPAGVTGIQGTFNRGDPVRILDADGTPLGVGLTSYSAADAKRIAGHQTGEVARILGYEGRTALIHRDDLVLSAETGSDDQHPEAERPAGTSGERPL